MTLDTSADLGNVGGIGTLTAAYTVTGATPILFVGVKETLDASPLVTGVTFNGVALALVAQDKGTGGRWTELYMLQNAPAGTFNIVISANGPPDFIGAVAASYADAATTGQPDSSNHTNTASANNLTPSTTVVAGGCWTVAIITNEAGLASAGTGTTQRQSNANGLFIGDSNGTVGTGAQTLQATRGAATIWAGVIASFAPSRRRFLLVRR